MRLSWDVVIVILALVGLSGCAGVQQRGRSSSPMQGLSVDMPGRPGWPTSRFFRWRTAAAEPRVETSRRVGPETDIWPDRSRSALSRLLSSARPAKSADDSALSSLDRRDSSRSSGRLTVAEANEAIARAARPRTRDGSVLATGGEAKADDRDKDKNETPDSPPLLTASIPLPDAPDQDENQDAAEPDAEVHPPSAASDPEAVLAQAPPPPPLRPTPSPAPRAVEPEPEPEPEPVEPEPSAEPVAPSLKPIEVTPPVAPAAPEPESKPEPIEAEPVMEAPSPFRETVAPLATAQEARYAPVVAPTPQVYFDSPEAAAPPYVEARPRWVFWPWKRSRSAGGEFPVESRTPAQLPPVQFPASYDSVAARPLVPCPDNARVVTPTAQQQVVLPSPQGIAAPPIIEKHSHLKAMGARLHDRLERLRAWKDEHICRHIQNFKAALKGGKCAGCGGHARPLARPLASPQGSPVLATSQFGLY